MALTIAEWQAQYQGPTFEIAPIVSAAERRAVADIPRLVEEEARIAADLAYSARTGQDEADHAQRRDEFSLPRFLREAL